MKYFINLSPLYRNRNFGLLYVGQFVSFIGTMITGVAAPYQIYHETHSTLMVGLLSLAQLIPLMFTALWGGALADRHHRRQLLLFAESFMALGCLSLALNAYFNWHRIVVLFIIASLMSAINGLHRPALDSITQQLVSKKEFPLVSPLITFKYSVCMIAGPALGGLLLAQFGLVLTYFVDFLTFLISLMAILLMSHIPKPKTRVDESTWSALKQGFKYAMSRQALVGTYAVDFIAMIFGMPNALFPAIAHHMHGSVKVLGMLYAAPAVGALCVSFFSSWAKVKRYGAGIAWAAIFWGISIIFFGLFSYHLWVGLFFLACAGAFDAISGIFRQIMWNEIIDQEFRGRLAGIEMISYLSGPKLGDTEAGLVASAFGITASIVSGGILCVVGVGICCYFLPKFWYFRSEITENPELKSS